MRVTIGAALLLSIPFSAAACPTFEGVDYARIHRSDVLIEGEITSFEVDLARTQYRIEVKVKSTIKGVSRDTWTVLSQFETPPIESWTGDRQVLIGFDAIDVNNGLGKLPGSPCGPLGIVPATKENLGKIFADVRESSAF